MTRSTSSNPMTHVALGMGCDKAWFGWPSDQGFEALRTKWAFAPDIATPKQLAVEFSKRPYEPDPYGRRESRA